MHTSISFQGLGVLFPPPPPPGWGTGQVNLNITTLRFAHNYLYTWIERVSMERGHVSYVQGQNKTAETRLEPPTLGSKVL